MDGLSRAVECEQVNELGERVGHSTDDGSAARSYRVAIAEVSADGEGDSVILLVTDVASGSSIVLYRAELGQRQEDALAVVQANLPLCQGYASCIAADDYFDIDDSGVVVLLRTDLPEAIAAGCRKPSAPAQWRQSG